MKFLRIFVGVLSGALCAALFCAALFWTTAYTDPRSWYLGPIRDWAPVFAFYGAMFGLIGGSALGLLIGVFNPGRAVGVLLGLGLALIAVAYYLIEERPAEWHMKSIIVRAAFVCLGAVTGLLTVISTARTDQWTRLRRDKRTRSQLGRTEHFVEPER